MKVCTAVNAGNVLLKVQIWLVHSSYEVMQNTFLYQKTHYVTNIQNYDDEPMNKPKRMGGHELEHLTLSETDRP